MARKRRGSGVKTVASFFSEENKQKAAAAEGEVSLLSIRPDPGQPRRLLPLDLIQALNAGEISPQEAITSWQARVEEDNTLQQNWEELQKLAGSIARHGLINPISVRLPRSGEQLPKGKETLPAIQYLIVTGERRWWAHVLLLTEERQIHEGDKVNSPQKIKVTLAADGISVRAHQLIENLNREELGAIEKAEGMWALRYELSEGNNGSVQPSPEASKANLAPWKSIEESLGISKRYRSYVTSVLLLSPEAIELVRTHQLAERLIRPITQKLRNEPDLQIEALNQLIAWQQDPSQEAPSGSLTKAISEFVLELLQPPDSDKDETEVVTEAQSTATKAPMPDMPAPISETVRAIDEEPAAGSTHEAEGPPGKQADESEQEPVNVPSQALDLNEKKDELKGSSDSSLRIGQVKRFKAKARAGSISPTQINEMIEQARGAGADVIELNHTELLTIESLFSDGTREKLDLKQPHETVLVLRFPSVM